MLPLARSERGLDLGQVMAELGRGNAMKFW